MKRTIILFLDLNKRNKNSRKEYQVGKCGSNQRNGSKPAEGLSAIKTAEAENNKTGYKHQRSINDTDAGAMYSFYDRLFLIIIIKRQFLFVIN